jgi:hypothetical protein
MPAYCGKTKEDPHLQFDGTLMRARKGQATRKIRSRVLAARHIPRSDGKMRYAIAQVRDRAVQRSPLHCICPCVSSIYLPGIRCILLTASDQTTPLLSTRGRVARSRIWLANLPFESSRSVIGTATSISARLMPTYLITQLFLEALDRSFAELRDDGFDDFTRMRGYRDDNWMFVGLWFL